MKTAGIIAQIRSLEAQLALLRARVEALEEPAPPKTFADLYGILAGKADSSEEEIDAVLHRFDWDEEDADEPAEESED